MNKFGLALVVLGLIAVPYSRAFEIFSIDCEGGIRFLPSTPIGMSFDFSAMLGVADTFLSLYKQRLTCMCPGLTDDEFNRLFHPFFGVDMAFNIQQGPDADLTLSSCSWSVFNDTIMRANRYNYLKMDLTDSCTISTWKNTGKCLIQSQAFSDWDVSFKAGMFRCPKSPWRPAMSVICEGSGCQQAFIPCTSNSDCAGDMTCQTFVFDDIVRPSPNDILQAFKTMLLADDLSSTCVNTGDVVMKTLDLVRKMWKQGSSTYNIQEAKICSPIQLNFKTNTSFDWQNLIHYTGSSYVVNDTSISIPGYLQSWNGNLMNGAQMTAPQNVATKPSDFGTLTQGATLLFKKTCDGVMTFLPTSVFGVSVNMGFARKMIDHWVSTVSSVLKCRFNALGVSMSDQEMTNRWALGLDWIFYNVDAKNANAAVSGNLQDFSTNFPSRVNLPSSCSYDSWVNRGSCHATYTGLSSLLGVDVSANIEIKKCDASADFSFVVECVGAACSLISGKTTTCNSNSDCPNSLTCRDLNPNFGGYDWMNAYVGLNTTKHPSCARSADSIQAEIRQLILSYLGMSFDGSSANKYCMVDYDHVMSQVSTWVNGEVETNSPGVVTLKNLKSWDDPGTAAPGATSWALSVIASFNFVLFALGLTLSVV